MREGSFDFGVKPPEEGYIKITGKTLYDDEKGYGLDDYAEGEERKTGDKELLRDFLFLGGRSFG